LFFLDSETKDNWIWFIEQLRKSIGIMPRLTIFTNHGFYGVA